jgi:probable HAF family extracellular repeat protein
MRRVGALFVSGVVLVVSAVAGCATSEPVGRAGASAPPSPSSRVDVESGAATPEPSLSKTSPEGFSMVRLGATVTVLDELVVNNSGQVAGSSRGAWLWDPRTGKRDLGGAKEWSHAQGLNEQGQVVGIASRYVEDRQEDHTFFWDPATGMHDLGTVPLGNSVRVIDERGLVTGTSMTPEDLAAMASPNSDYRGLIGVFQWDLAAGRRDLGTLDPNAWVADINDNGQVAYVVESDSFRWDPDTGEQQIDRLDEGDSTATAINAAGQVVGALWTDGREGSRAFVWDPDEGTRDLGTLAGPRSEATAINARGQVAGIARTAQGSDQTSHAWRWDPVTGIDDLGHAFEVADINEKGQVAGTSRTTAGHYQAWLWDPVTGRVNLGAPGDHDTTASALNDRGQVAGWAGTIPWEIEYSDDEELETAGDAVLWTPIGS